MKKLLAIMVLGLLLSNCDQFNNEKKTEYKPDFLRAIENCADYDFEFDRKLELNLWIAKGKNYEKEIAKEKIEYWSTIHKKPLDIKMKNKIYPYDFSFCEKKFNLNPKKFKEKWL
tara:strand:+ start:52 stop:396 length:345 start_codon:yes stop_codon:yes gene_type:complete